MEDFNIGDILYRVSVNVRAARRFQYIVESKQFRDLFVNATTVDKQRLDLLIRTFDVDGLKRFMEDLRSRDYHLMTARELRKLAALRSIEDYNILRKEEIIDELISRDNNDFAHEDESASVEGRDLGTEIRQYFESESNRRSSEVSSRETSDSS